MVVALCDVIETAEVADPFSPVSDEAHEWVNICTTLTAPDDRLAIKASCGDCLARRKLAEGFNADSERDIQLFLQVVSTRDAIRGHS